MGLEKMLKMLKSKLEGKAEHVNSSQQPITIVSELREESRAPLDRMRESILSNVMAKIDRSSYYLYFSFSDKHLRPVGVSSDDGLQTTVNDADFVQFRSGDHVEILKQRLAKIMDYFWQRVILPSKCTDICFKLDTSKFLVKEHIMSILSELVFHLVDSTKDCNGIHVSVGFGHSVAVASAAAKRGLSVDKLIAPCEGLDTYLDRVMVLLTLADFGVSVESPYDTYTVKLLDPFLWSSNGSPLDVCDVFERVAHAVYGVDMEPPVIVVSMEDDDGSKPPVVYAETAAEVIAAITPVDDDVVEVTEVESLPYKVDSSRLSMRKTLNGINLIYELLPNELNNDTKEFIIGRLVSRYARKVDNDGFKPFKCTMQMMKSLLTIIPYKNFHAYEGKNNLETAMVGYFMARSPVLLQSAQDPENKYISLKVIYLKPKPARESNPSNTVADQQTIERSRSREKEKDRYVDKVQICCMCGFEFEVDESPDIIRKHAALCYFKSFVTVTPPTAPVMPHSEGIEASNNTASSWAVTYQFSVPFNLPH